MVFSGFLLLVGLFFGDIPSIPAGLWAILTTEDTLITDYIQIGGIGAAFVNAALVTAASVCLLARSDETPNGYTLVTVGLMAGFSLFGKNIVNIWPILAGAWLYAKLQREHFGKYVSVALLTTALAPVVSFVALGGRPGSLPAGAALGIAIGFVLPPLSAYTFRVQNGMNLYNVGFACGLTAMLLVPVMTNFGARPQTALHWSLGNNLIFAPALAGLCVLLILAGLFLCKRPPWEAWAGYRRLLLTTGRAPSDYLRMFGSAPVLINTGVNGLLAGACILFTGGDLNGPTLGGIFTIMGFSAFGKHARSILPVMAGVLLGGALMEHGVNAPALQLAVLFGTTLAPLSGYFGWPFGIAAGFLHASVVLHAGTPVAGLNLYNNGFSGGLIAIALFPILTAVFRRHKPVLQDEDYFDLFTHDTPQPPPPPAEERRSGEEAPVK
ncbi:conserved membrane hypothetical protein [uncultured Eubacteriales bacterium]|uniref:DUF1576 domain-containing protein n=1 Tax=uncultured Eubacteriales bacterium TaxID=172733 RepID=A0A212KF40_9FIRM|nr:conserved membrane hypothetical protein [uncultured Eubacteriales bacterium]